MLATWPFVGRQKELQLIVQAMGSGDCHGMVLEGAPGVGKSRLAAEAVTAARAQGWDTVRVIATRAAASIPFGAVGHLVPTLDVSSADGLQLLGQVQRALVERAAGRRLAVLVDDAHLLDDGSAALMLQLAMTGTAFVLLTVRGGEVCPDPVVSIWKEELGPRLEVRVLHEAAVADLVTRVLDGHVDGATVHDLSRVTGGNPLFLRELLHTGLASGTLASADGVWRWCGPMAPGGALLRVVSDRLDGLGHGEKQLLEVLALAEPLAAGVVRRLGPAEIMAAAEAAGLLSASEEDGRTDLRLAHPLYGEVLRAATGPLRARELCHLLAEAMQATGCRRQDDLLRLATWRLEAGDEPPLEMLSGAARRALSIGDFRLAERLARAAIERGGGFAVRFVLGRALMGQQRQVEADGVLESTVAATDDEAARLAIIRATSMLCLGRIAEAEAILRRAPEATVDPLLRDGLTATRALTLISLGHLRQALATVSPLVDRPQLSGPAAILALTVSGACQALSGETDGALAATARGLHAVRGQGEGLLGGRGQLHRVEWFALLLAGRIDESDVVAECGYRRALTSGSHRARAMCSFQLGLGALFRGRAATARGWIQEATVLSREHDVAPTLILSLASLAEATALAGDVPRAQRILADDRLVGGGVVPCEEAWITLSAAWVTALGGNLAEGRALALRAAEIARGHGAAAFEALARHCVARLGDPLAVADHLSALVDGLDGVLLPTLARHAAALAAGDGTALDEVADAFHAMGALLCAAEASADAARAHQRTSDLPRARASHARATRLAGQCEGATTPALTCIALPDALTPREQEIAHLASVGLSSREIAQRLALATRTVDNTLHRAYAKLEVRSRRGLASVLRLPGLDAAR